jgi:transposase
LLSVATTPGTNQLVEEQVEQLDLEIAAYMKQTDSYITTIPGIGPVLGAVILSELGDISRFEDAKKLVAYAGIDAAVNQSGNFEGTEVHMSKRGSPYLRRALYTAANVAAFHDPELSAYYQRLRQRGKPPWRCCRCRCQKALLFYIQRIVRKPSV